MILLPFIVALAIAGAGVYAAYRNPALGTAILVGVGILGVLYVVLVTDPTAFPTDVTPATTAPHNCQTKHGPGGAELCSPR